MRKDEEIKMRKSISLFLVILLMVGMTACGGGTSTNTPAPKTEFYLLETMIGPDYDDEPMSAEGYYTLFEMLGMSREEVLSYILMHPDGKLDMVSFGLLLEGTWAEGKFTFTEGNESMTMEYSTVDGKLIVKDEEGNELTYVSSEETPPPLPTPRIYDEEGDEGEENSTDYGYGVIDDSESLSYLDWWEGEWYGYWTITSGTGEFEELEGGVWDCYAIIDINADGTGVVHIWDDDWEIGSVILDLNEGYGVGYMGGGTADGGTLFGDPVGRADWIIRPTFGGAPDNQIDIEETYTTKEEDFFARSDMSYKIVLRPWGALWDDLPEDKRPPYYEDWYVGQDAYIESMHTVLHELDEQGLFVHERAFADDANHGDGNVAADNDKSAGSGDSGARTGF